MDLSYNVLEDEEHCREMQHLLYIWKIVPYKAAITYLLKNAAPLTLRHLTQTQDRLHRYQLLLQEFSSCKPCKASPDGENLCANTCSNCCCQYQRVHQLCKVKGERVCRIDYKFRWAAIYSFLIKAQQEIWPTCQGQLQRLNKAECVTAVFHLT